jgi:hypothetical protein
MEKTTRCPEATSSTLDMYVVRNSYWQLFLGRNSSWDKPLPRPLGGVVKDGLIINRPINSGQERDR